MRTCTVCRELSKLHEEVVRGKAAELYAEFAQRDAIRGEVVLVIDGPSDEEFNARSANDSARAAERASELLEQGASPKAVVRQLVAEFGIPRNQAYDMVLSNK